MFTSDEILKMKMGDLFSGNIDTIKVEFRKYAMEWHPDHNSSPEANTVFNHIKMLYENAIVNLRNGHWVSTNKILFTTTTGKQHNLRYRKQYTFEFGDMYVSDTVLVYVVDKKFKDFFDNAKKNIGSFKYANDRMKTECSKYLPEIKTDFETKDGKLVLVINKTKDLFLLKDILEYFNGELTDRHVAWIISTLYNMSCYLSYTGLAHNNIALNTYFISPEYHSGALLGGWWYAGNRGEKMIGVPTKTYDLMPPDIKASKIASCRVDLELIRAIGRELLGDSTGGIHLLKKKNAPEDMIFWLRSVTTGKAVKDYQLWGDVLKESFGPRRFVVMDVDETKLYK